MKAYAIIENQSVVNVALWDGASSWTPGENYVVVLIPEGTNVGIGWSYIDGQFIDPDPIIES